MALSVAIKVKRMRIALGKTQAEFGELLDPPVSQGTVARWERGSMPEPQRLAQLAELAGETIERFIDSGGGSTIIPLGRALQVKGSVAAGVWREAWEWPEEEWFPYIGGLHVDVPADRRFGLKVEGDSMNMVYPHGTILDCVSIHDIGPPKSGRNVVVIRRRVDGSLEATVKEYVEADGRKWLVPRSTNPAFQQPVPVDDGGPDVVETTILALVVGSYRPE